ncbi:serine protease [Streptomyces sp. NBC_00083]|uniref:trypsin-like serine peptidase n=1 Tax=Streptomyces sp. NBC_00083 TaxID=2975647 RepID=UPI00224FAF25|nr:trypsin-like peptidase domain-containing protein [Streptomyces sp. NBC_00083]MCX5384063.1 serine protease [Streptomyces sp. NBC_00083]
MMVRRDARDGRRPGRAGGVLVGAAVLLLVTGPLMVSPSSPAVARNDTAAVRARPSATAALSPPPPADPRAGPPAGAGADSAEYRRSRPELPAGCIAERRRPEPHDVRPACSYPVVGVFLRPGGRKTCTGAVVAGGHGDLLVTAAHCLPLDGTSFAPGYHDGTAPYGRWPVLAAVPDPRFAEARKGARNWPYDWAFVRVARVGGKSVREAVGSAFEVPPHPESLPSDLGRVTLVGYPHDRPGQHVCTVDSAPAYGGFRQARCAGFSSGVSGSPWVLAAREGEGIVVGVLGGAERGGGFLADVSYTARFDAGLASLFATAQGIVPRASPSVAPAARRDAP